MTSANVVLWAIRHVLVNSVVIVTVTLRLSGLSPSVGIIFFVVCTSLRDRLLCMNQRVNVVVVRVNKWFRNDPFPFSSSSKDSAHDSWIKYCCNMIPVSLSSKVSAHDSSIFHSHVVLGLL